SGAESSVFYDTVQGVTGMPSSEASEAGCAFLVLRLREQCAPSPKARGRARRRALAAGGPLGR
ncbi:MAG: hypothetical protein ACRDH5_06355, partial [bacterium]